MELIERMTRRGIGQRPGCDPGADWLMFAGECEAETCSHHLAQLILDGAAVV